MPGTDEPQVRITIETSEDFRRQAHAAVRLLNYDTLKDFLVEKLQDAINQTTQPVKPPAKQDFKKPK